MTSPFLFSFGFMPPSSPTPTFAADVMNYIVQVNGEIAALRDDMNAASDAGKVVFPVGFLDQFSKFIAEWNAFRDNYLSVAWSVTIPSSAWDQVGQYEAKNEAWREKFKALGGTSVGPGPQDRPAPTDWSGTIKWVAAAAIVGGAAYVAHQVGMFK